jgi:hypothetical protein
MTYMKEGPFATGRGLLLFRYFLRRLHWLIVRPELDLV